MYAALTLNNPLDSSDVATVFACTSWFYLLFFSPFLYGGLQTPQLVTGRHA